MSLIGHSAQLLLITAIGVSSFAMADTSDPFATQALTAPSPAESSATPAAPLPCDSAASPATDLSLSDVVERALCNNPQTHEAWANARVQAAQLGVSKAADLPTLSADGSLSHNATNGRGTQTAAKSYDQRSVGLSLSYLLYDFGARGATIDNAKQVLIAANAAQDTAIQSVFLAAVQAYYQIFATQSAIRFGSYTPSVPMPL